jgi:hypothetical protein
MGKGEVNVNTIISQLQIVIHLRTLLVLSQLAVIDNSIKPPPSTIQSIPTNKAEEHPSPAESKRTVISIHMRDFLGCISDEDNEHYMVI